MNKKLIIVLAIATVIALPLIFRKESRELPIKADEKIVIITPHLEHIRFEIGHGFQEWYKQKTGKTVFVDWRYIGSGGEVFKYVDSMFVNMFRVYWERDLKRKWDYDIENGFIDLHAAPGTMGEEARKIFLQSNVGCGIDILFGGGIVEHKREANLGNIISCGIVTKRPDLFNENNIPEFLSGERLYDKDQQWIGANLSGYGIGYNRDTLKKLGFEGEPKVWEDIANPCLVGQVAFVDPNKSSIVPKMFETILQYRIQECEKELKQPNLTVAEIEKQSIIKGWDQTISLIQRMAANARYFSDVATKNLIDITSGNCAIGLLIDFYGRYQIEYIKGRSGSTRFGYVTPVGQSMSFADPIALFRGAPNPEVAKAFIEYVISLAGQKIIDFKVGTPGGPIQYPISRTPINKAVLDPKYNAYRIDTSLDPFKETGNFVYREQLTKGVFSTLKFIPKVAFIDAHRELVGAWKAIIKAKKQNRMDDYNAAMAVFSDYSEINYEKASGKLKNLLQQKDHLKVIQEQTRLTNHFRKQFRKAEKLANGENI